MLVNHGLVLHPSAKKGSIKLRIPPRRILGYEWFTERRKSNRGSIPPHGQRAVGCAHGAAELHRLRRRGRDESCFAPCDRTGSSTAEGHHNRPLATQASGLGVHTLIAKHSPPRKPTSNYSQP